MQPAKELAITLLVVGFMVELTFALQDDSRDSFIQSSPMSNLRARQVRSASDDSSETKESTGCDKKKKDDTASSKRRQLSLLDFGKLLGSGSEESIVKVGSSEKNAAKSGTNYSNDIKSNQLDESSQNPLLSFDIVAKINEMIELIQKSLMKQFKIPSELSDYAARSSSKGDYGLDQEKTVKLQMSPDSKDGGLMKILTDSLTSTKNQVESFMNDNLGIQIPTLTDKGSSEVNIENLMKSAKRSMSSIKKPASDTASARSAKSTGVSGSSARTMLEEESDDDEFLDEDSQLFLRSFASKTILEIIELLSRIGAQKAVDGDYVRLLDFLDKIKWLTIAYNFGI